jgi:DNA-directed RNA polymerase subunit RPC12/RpoP
VIKFQCLNCGQKLAVGDEGVGAVISCTNCTERIVVPPFSITQFFPAEPTKLRSTPVAGGLELIRPARERIENVPATAREALTPTLVSALIPQLARMMMNRLVQALFAQRENLIDTQAEATKRMAELEERIARAQVSVQGRFAAYDNRIAELERQLAAAEEEKRNLMRQNFQLAKNALEAENAAPSGRVSLREAGFLLRA